jgi:hypothetical protein
MYLARALVVSTAPADPLYKPVNNFFIAKQLVDLTVVPDFLTLFHDSDVESVERRIWILEVIRDGTKTMTDINVVFKTMCLKMIMDFYSSVLCDRKVKERILSVINSVIAVPRALEILLDGYGLISWLHAVVRQLGKGDRILIKAIFKITRNILHSTMINSYAKHMNTSKNGNRFIDLKTNKEVENEMLIILYDLLQFVNGLETGDIVFYIQTFNLLSRRAIKLLTKKQILTLVGKISNMFTDSECIKLFTNAIIANDINILKSSCIHVDSIETKDNLLNELLVLTDVYIA